MTTGKTIALTRRTFVGEVMSLLFNMLSCHNFSSKEPWFSLSLNTHTQTPTQEHTRSEKVKKKKENATNIPSIS